MDMNFSPAHRAFRAELRAFVEQSLPADLRRRTLRADKPSMAGHLRWQRILAQKGWLGHCWKKVAERRRDKTARPLP